MEQRLNSPPARQSESEGSCKKNGGGPCAFVTPDFLVSSAAETKVSKEKSVHADLPFHIM